MSPSFHKSLNLPLNTDIHTHSHSGVKSSMYVSQQTKEKHKPIQENNYAAKLPKKRGRKAKEKERKMWINNIIYVAVLRCAYCLVIMIIVCLLFVRPVADLLTDRVSVSVSVCVHTALAFYLSNEILRMRALASPRFRFQASASKCADLSRFGLKQNNSSLTHTRTQQTHTYTHSFV